ncbi:DUF502 domain-containing protein [Marinicella sp. S1101]|uniref:DUF502 domain-containing protein n=1 Tax=Marinicella marina TaxID=2996016 RepID=UPI002260FDB0|nr:DUF502 domain-containing protein [Marinicella marina]MCX7552995.1 DUF502 domain-containing protein [Marinicella marina]MDJ1139695.1 DUF502 domain-containing protein [Marinicella marina]
MKKMFLKPLLKGSLVVFPVLVTIWVIWSLVTWIDSLGRKALEPLMLDSLLFPGSGLVIVIIILLVVGLLFQFNFIKWIFDKVEKNLMKFPLVKTVYSAVKDLAGMFDNNQNKDQQVVLVNMQASGLGYLVGMITNVQLPTAISSKTGDKELVAVYLPMSYMVGGYTILVKRDKVKAVDWSFEEAMRFALTAGVSKESQSSVHQV